MLLKYHKLISFCIGLAFLIVVQKFSTPEPVFRFLLPAFLIYAGVVSLYSRWYLKKIDKYNVWLVVRSLLLVSAAFGVFLIIPNDFFRGMFLIFAVVVISFFEIISGHVAENILIIETLLIAIGLFLTFAGLYQYIPDYGTLYLAAVCAGSGLLARSLFEFIPQPVAVKKIASIVLALFTAETFWALNFLPFHYSVLALLLFNLFYICLIFNYYHFFHILNSQKILFHLFLIAACDAVVLTATRWKIIA